MPAAPIPADDDLRVAALARYNILDTGIEEIFDRITLMAKSMFATPIALVSLVDRERQWFKSHIGLDACETPRDQAFCGYAILQNEPLVVGDATKDPRFSDNPLVTSEPHIRFYAGAQLVTHDGHVLGTLCIIDRAPRAFTDVDVRLLRDLARLAMNEIELKLIQSAGPGAGQAARARRYENRDRLTNEYNSQTFRKLFETECQRSNRHSGSLSLAIVRLDNGGEIGEAFGSAALDEAIRAIAAAAKSIMRSSDCFARVSADEFALLMPNTRAESAETVVRRLLRRVTGSQIAYSGRTFSCEVNIGVATKSVGQRAADFYKEAEINRRTADSQGKNTYVASFAA